MSKPQKTLSTSHMVTTVGERINAMLKDKDLSVPKKIVKDIIQGFLSVIEESLQEVKKIRLDKIGILQVKDRAARMGRNPQTGEEIKILASKKVAFRAAKSLKEKVTGKITKKAIKKSTKVAKKPAKKKK